MATNWYSTFDMLQKAFYIRSMLNAVESRVSDLRELIVTDEYWQKAEIIQECLQQAASVRNTQSSSLYVSLSLSLLAFQSLMKKCTRVVSSKNELLLPIAELLLEKLRQHESAVSSDVSLVTRCLDSWFWYSFF